MRTSWETFQHAWAKAFGSAADCRKPKVRFDLYGRMVKFPDIRYDTIFAGTYCENYRSKCLGINRAMQGQTMHDRFVENPIRQTRATKRTSRSRRPGGGGP